jgi:hypothetical protein
MKNLSILVLLVIALFFIGCDAMPTNSGSGSSSNNSGSQWYDANYGVGSDFGTHVAPLLSVVKFSTISYAVEPIEDNKWYNSEAWIDEFGNINIPATLYFTNVGSYYNNAFISNNLGNLFGGYCDAITLKFKFIVNEELDIPFPIYYKSGLKTDEENTEKILFITLEEVGEWEVEVDVLDLYIDDPTTGFLFDGNLEFYTDLANKDATLETVFDKIDIVLTEYYK